MILLLLFNSCFGFQTLFGEYVRTVKVMLTENLEVDSESDENLIKPRKNK